MTKQKKRKRMYKVQYRKIYVWLPFNPRKGVCRACGKSVKRKEIKTTQLHHTIYAYLNKTVKENPILVLDNTIELCFTHHRLADAVRVLTYYNPLYIVELVDVLPEKQKAKLISVCREV